MSLNFFHGVPSERVNHGTDASTDIGTTATMAAWIYRRNNVGNDRILCKAEFASGACWLTFTSETALLFFRYREGATSLGVKASKFAVDPETLNRWMFVAGSLDGGGTTFNQHLYVGDEITPLREPRAYMDRTVGDGTYTSNSGEPLIAGNLALFSQTLDGYLAWAAMWDRPLSYSELLAQQYNPHLSPGCKLFCYYGEHGEGVQRDLSGNGNDGTVTGATKIGARPAFLNGNRYGSVPRIVRPVYPAYTAKRT